MFWLLVQFSFFSSLHNLIYSCASCDVGSFVAFVFSLYESMKQVNFHIPQKEFQDLVCTVVEVLYNFFLFSYHVTCVWHVSDIAQKKI